MSKILITGATGGLGSAVADFLSKKIGNKDISVLVRDPKSEKAADLRNMGFELRVGDYDDKSSLLKAFEGTDILYFVSGSDLAARMPQHKNVIEAATEAKIGHLFYTSASLKDLSPDSPLYPGMSAHIETEKRIRESGINYTILRHNLYAEVIPMFLGDRNQLLNTESIYLPAGSGKTAFVPRIELAEAGANALANADKNKNKIYELNGNEKVAFSEIADYLTAITGKSISYVSPEVKEFEETLSKHGVPEQYIGLMSVFGQGIADGVFDSPTTDIDAILGRKTLPVKSFLEMVYKQ